MTKPLPHEMIEATRLTQAGRLSEATALLQKLLRLGSTASDEGDAHSHRTFSDRRCRIP